MCVCVCVRQVLDGHQVGADGRPEGATRAVHVRVHQLVHEPDRVRSVQHPHQEDAGDAGETTDQYGVHRMHHRNTSARAFHISSQGRMTTTTTTTTITTTITTYVMINPPPPPPVGRVSQQRNRIRTRRVVTSAHTRL